MREARLTVRELGDLPGDVAANAELVLSELVTNAIIHGGLWPNDLIEVLLRRDDDRLTIEVDAGDGFYGPAERRPARPRRLGGQRRKVLDTLCEWWYADAGRVSAEIRL